MDERRQRNRHATELQIEVFDVHSGQCLGRIVDLSMDGFMLLSELPLEADSLPAEIAAALRRCRDCQLIRAGRTLAEALVAAEEKRLVHPVIELRNNNRTAGRTAEFVAIKGRIRWCKKIAGGKLAVAVVFEQAAVQLVCS